MFQALKQRSSFKCLSSLVKPSAQTGTGLMRLATPCTSIVSAQRSPFSSNIVRIEKSLQSLRTSLDNEINYENENYEPVKQAEEFLQYSGFQLVENENPYFITISKRVYGMTVKVSFESQPPEIDDYDEGDNQSEQPQEFKDMFEDSIHDVTVTICPGDENGEGMIAELTIHGDKLYIVHMVKVENVAEVMRLSRYERSSTRYLGPEFDSLDPSLKQALQEYLGDLGINDDIIAFVDAMALDQDQKLYMKWLQQSKDFLIQ
ncbi:unnamed protein product [Moneuplotes crassus]|uniref:Mitochondrial acidic protein MAM33 n=1 Tax=Euplotes crassus TaxID=5936 RepID=A0AAD1XRC7_EUPCR|nr:unnamed protein product [Moneuplotes crassus]